MIEYIIKSTLCLGVSILLYYIFLKPGNNFTFNRYYLLSTLILALSVPVFNFSSTHAMPVVNKISISTNYENNYERGQVAEDENIEATRKSQFPVQKVFLVYIIGVIVFVLRFAANLLNLVSVMNKKGTKINGFYVRLMKNCYNPYSFFNYLFINKRDFDNKEYSDSLFEHERVHSKQFHSIDIILIELVKCFLWFNPFVWLYKNAISENHEFIADSIAIKKGIDKNRYLNHMIRCTNNDLNSSILISGFSYKHTKNRLIMLNKTRKPLGKQVFRLFLAITLTGAFFTLNSFKIKTSKPFVVVVDAGHGGKDKGSTFNNISEKDVNLNISTKLADLTGKDNIKIVLVRSKDKFVSLENRVKTINELKPDILLSIHCDYAKNDNLRGTTVYYSDKDGFNTKSYSYSKTILSEHIKNVTDKGQIKTADFYILENSDCPGILLQLGFLSNKNDLSILSDNSYQDQIANSIYNSLVKISN